MVGGGLGEFGDKSDEKRNTEAKSKNKKPGAYSKLVTL